MSAKGRKRAEAPATEVAAPTVVLASDRFTLYRGDHDLVDIGTVIAPESIDAIVTDPPSGIEFMGKEWDSDKGGRDHWIAWLAGIMRRALVLLKPGGHALVWALPRTSHWTATAVEDAGFEIRDVGIHLFGTGFPKSLDVSKAIDEAAGVSRGSRPDVRNGPNTNPATKGDKLNGGYAPSAIDTGPVTPEAARFTGIGTALKPAAEHWILARKPLAGTVAQNVLAFGTGGLNIDACRIGTSKDVPASAARDRIGQASKGDERGRTMDTDGFNPAVGRWPAHVTLDEDAARALDEQSGVLQSGSCDGGFIGDVESSVALGDKRAMIRPGLARGDSGGASRFFYIAKPARSEKDAGLDHLPIRTGGEATDREEGSAGLNNPRAGSGRTGGVRNHHPTVKSVDLMRWLCRLITPRGGTVLDLFTGSGTTGIAALAEGMRFIGIERDAAFCDVAAGRLAHAACLPTPERIADDGKPVEAPRQPSLFDTLGATP